MIRPAHPEDAEHMADLAEQKRVAYEQYQPIFWRQATDAREKHLPFL